MGNLGPSSPSLGSSERWSRHPHRSRRHRGAVGAGPAGRRRLPALGRPHAARGWLPDDADRAVRDSDLRVDAHAARSRHPRRGLGPERELVRQDPDPRGELRRQDPLHRYRAAGGGREYLGTVAHANVQEIDFDPFRATYLSVSGGAPRAPPTEQSFWAASASGVGTQTLTWNVREGDWSVVLMNADGSRGVAADVDLGAKLSFLLWVAIGLLIGGVLVSVGSTALIVLAARRPRPPPTPPAPPTEGREQGSTEAPEAPNHSTEVPPAASSSPGS